MKLSQVLMILAAVVLACVDIAMGQGGSPVATLRNRPAQFEENLGQLPAPYDCLVRANGLAAYLSARSVAV